MTAAAAAWLVVWSVILGPDDPRLLRTLIEVPEGRARCEELAVQIGLAGRLEGHQVLELQCVKERPRGVRRPGLKA